jgi:glucose-1-phosphate thymidylyltransferase
MNNEQIDCIVLCGGYSKRLWPLTYDISKVLLPVAGKLVLEYTLDNLQETSGIKTIWLSVNKKFAEQIESFQKRYVDKLQHTGKVNHVVDIIIEPTTNQREKLGPIGALDYIVSCSEPRDLLVIGGDNIFNFCFEDFLNFVLHMKGQYSSNATYENPDQSNLKLYGLVDVDTSGNIIEFQEKPDIVNSNNVSAACYYLRKKDVVKIRQYIKEGQDPDSLGGFIRWLWLKKTTIKSYPFSGYWFDIGTRDSLLLANAQFLKHSIPTIQNRTKYVKPVYIDKQSITINNSQLGPNVSIGSDVIVEGSDISNSIIMDKCNIKNSIIRNSVIGPGSRIETQVVDMVCAPYTKLA